MNKLSLLIFCSWLLIGLRAQGQTQQQPATPAGAAVAVDENIVYAVRDGVDLHLDLYRPSGGTGGTLRPAIILVHGGSWLAGDKSSLKAMGNFLARSGYVAFSVEYRLFTGKKNHWPAPLDDVQTAVRWMRANAAKYGVAPAKMGAFGHSAGAQLAALLGMEDTRDNSDKALAGYSSRVQAVVDVSGPTDFTSDHNPDAAAFLANFLGASLQSKPEVWRAASPLFHVSKDCAPFLIVHGTQDVEVPMAQSEKFYERLMAAGVTASLVKVNDEHTFKTPEARRQLALESLAFFTQQLGVPK